MEPHAPLLFNACRETEARGELAIEDIPRASRSFLAAIAGQVFWPELVKPGCGGSDEDAVALTLAR